MSTMLASEVEISYPAIRISERLGVFDEVDPDEMSFAHASWLQSPYRLKAEIFDSAGRRFLVTGVRRLGKVGPFWKWWLPEMFSDHIYEIDLELQELPPEPFERVLARVVKIESGNAGNLDWTEDHPDFLAWLDELRRCASIADIAAFGNPPEDGEAAR